MTLPLAGLRVVELPANGPVPFAGSLLQSLGARVLRILPPSLADDLGTGIPPAYDVLNSGKSARRLDLKNPDGMEALRAELGDTDLLLEGFRPGVLERLGLAPATLLESFPRLVIGRLSGWGTRGPLAMRAGHDINYLALSGALAAIGTGDEPAVPLNLVADFGGGAMHLLTGVLAKLLQRSITGRGGVVQTSILAGTIGLTSMFHGLLAGGLWQLRRCANLLDGGAPFYRVYRCRDDRFIAVGCIEPKFYRQLLDVTGLRQKIDPQAQYSEHTWAETAVKFAARFRTRTRDEWVEAAAGRDACLSPVLNFAEAAGDAHNRANDFFCHDSWARPGNMIYFSES